MNAYIYLRIERDLKRSFNDASLIASSYKEVPGSYFASIIVTSSLAYFRYIETTAFRISSQYLMVIGPTISIRWQVGKSYYNEF